MHLNGALFERRHVTAPICRPRVPHRLYATRRAAGAVTVSAILSGICGFAAASQLSAPHDDGPILAELESLAPSLPLAFETPHRAGYTVSEALAPHSARPVGASFIAVAKRSVPTTELGPASDDTQLELALSAAKDTPTLLERIAAPVDFDPAVASVAIATAARRAIGCVQNEDINAPVATRVTFAPTGRVTQASVAAGSLVGTQAGGCVAVALRGANIGQFRGPAVTVTATVHLR